MRNEIQSQLEEHRRVIEKIESVLTGRIAESVEMIVAALKTGNKILLCGNGGSAADSQHFAAEIVGRFKMERRGLPAIALTTDSSILTALGNDYGFDFIFSRQVEALASTGDIVIGISTSGNSPNVFKAFEKAKELGCWTIGLLGKDGGTISNLSDVSLVVPSSNTPRIQEGHLTIIHIICDLVEKKMFGE